MSVSRGTSKKSRAVETTISLDSSISSNSSHLQRSASPLSTCFIICAFLSVAVATAILTYAVTTTFSKTTEPPQAVGIEKEELAKIYQFMQNMQNWFVTHNHYEIVSNNPGDHDQVQSKCNYQVCGFKQRPPIDGWPKLPNFEWEEMNKSPYPIPQNHRSCNGYDENSNSTIVAD